MLTVQLTQQDILTWNLLCITQPDSTAYIILNQICNPLSEYSCKPQVWGAPREQPTRSGLVWWQPSLSESKSPWILLSYSLLPCHKASDWMIFEIYISVSKLPLRWFYFCSNIMTDVAICKRNNSPKAWNTFPRKQVDFKIFMNLFKSFKFTLTRLSLVCDRFDQSCKSLFMQNARLSTKSYH